MDRRGYGGVYVGSNILFMYRRIMDSRGYGVYVEMSIFRASMG
jgi:hypothetical protein